jgi:hypothetical protein
VFKAEVDDHAQGPPINSEPLVIERTHSNEKRVPKASTCLLAFVFLSASFSFRYIVVIEVVRVRYIRGSCSRVSEGSNCAEVSPLVSEGGLRPSPLRRRGKPSGGCCVGVHPRA